MTAPNLSRSDAQTRSRLLHVRRYDVWLDLTDPHGDAGEGTFGSRTSVTFACHEPGARSFVDVMPSSVATATLNGHPLDVGSVTETGVLNLGNLAEENRLELDGRFFFTTSYEGLQRMVDPADGEIYMHSTTFMAAAQRMFPCFDQPDLKAEFTFHVTAPGGWKVVSNGAESGRGPAGRGATTVHFAPTPPIPTYITAVFAGPYHHVADQLNGPNGPIELGLYCTASSAPFLDHEQTFALTKAGFDLYHDKFDYPYPFGKYDQIFGAEPGFGGMENAGAVGLGAGFIFRSRVSEADQQDLAYVVLHELAHMWFGDLVTTRWWDDSWLNEAFATYAGYYSQVEATHRVDAWARFAQEEKTWALVADQRRTTHPIAGDVIDLHTALSNFDDITYAKGASVLRQLVAYVGEEAFFRALRSYFREHEFANAELADLLRALEKASGRDLKAWSAEWLETASVNTLRPAFEVDSDGRFASFAVEQEALPGHPTLRTHRLAIGLYDEAGASIDRSHRVEVDVSGARTEIPELVGQRAPAVVIVNDDDLSYAKLRFDGASFEVIRKRIGSFQDSLARSLCWTAAWDMTRDGELSAVEYADLVLGGIDAETHPSVMTGLLANVEKAVRDYGIPEQLPESLQRLADKAWAAMTTVAPTSEPQLLWSRSFARVAGATGHAQRLRDLYDDELAVPGVDLDFETRWSLLHGLVPQGLADESDIASEFEREPNDMAEERAAKAGAMLPSATDKERTWTEVTAPEGISYAIRAAMAHGFWAPGQGEQLQPFVRRYFAELDAFWNLDGGGHTSSVLTRALFPHVIDEATIARADAWLEATPDRPTQRRTVIEARDELARALRNRTSTT